MRDRLIELLEATLEDWECDVSDKTILEIAEHLLANGVIVPPCEVGEHIYVIPSKENALKEITEMVARGFAIGEPFNVANCFRVRGTSALFQPSFEQFGKTVFLTKEEAEKALKGLQE